MTRYQSEDRGRAESLANSRNAERLSTTNRNMDDLKSQIAKLETVVNAMWEIMQEQGVDASVLNAKIDEIMQRKKVRKEYGNPKKPCPKCGRTIQESGKTPMRGRCVFCGEEVIFYPFANDDGEMVLDEPRDEDPLSNGEGSDNLNF